MSAAKVFPRGVEERNRKYEKWRAANKEDIARRMAEFWASYDELVEQHRLCIGQDGSGTLLLFDIDHKDGAVAEINEWDEWDRG